MKRLKVLLVSFVLICSSAFAAVSFTVGGGIASKAPAYEDREIILGPTTWIGADYERENGVTFYADTEFGYITITPNGNKKASGSYYNLALAGGLGFTKHIKDWTLMFGVGGEYQSVFDEAKEIKEIRYGFDTKCKATYACTESLGISLQADPSVDSRAFSADTIIDGYVFSSNLLVGFTFKY